MALFDEIKNSNTPEEMVKLFEQMLDKWASTDKSTKEILTENSRDSELIEPLKAIKTLFPSARSVTRNSTNHILYVRDIDFEVIATLSIGLDNFPLKDNETITIKQAQVHGTTRRIKNLGEINIEGCIREYLSAIKILFPTVKSISLNGDRGTIYIRDIKRTVIGVLEIPVLDFAI